MHDNKPNNLAGYIQVITKWICLCHVAVAVKRFKIIQYTARHVMTIFAPSNVMRVAMTKSGRIFEPSTRIYLLKYFLYFRPYELTVR
jgi:hypothetical protein